VVEVRPCRCHKREPADEHEIGLFINQAGRQLARPRRSELEKAKRLMQKTIEVAWRYTVTA
jgi:hypothetical protein